jgi:hypothetical protein
MKVGKWWQRAAVESSSSAGACMGPGESPSRRPRISTRGKNGSELVYGVGLTRLSSESAPCGGTSRSAPMYSAARSSSLDTESV